MQIKTKLDLNVSAHAAALNAVPLKDGLAVEQHKLAAFTTDAGNAADWPFWSQQFAQHLNDYKVLAAQPAPSVAAIAAAAASAPAN